MDLKEIGRRLLPALAVSCVLALAWFLMHTWPTTKPRPVPAVRTAVTVGHPTIETAIGAVVDQHSATRAVVLDSRQVLAEGMYHELVAARDSIIEAVRAEAQLTRQVIAMRYPVPDLPAALPPSSAAPVVVENAPPPSPAPEPRPVIQRPRPKPTKMLASTPPQPKPEAAPAAVADAPPWQPRFPRPAPAPERTWQDDVARR